MMRTLMAGALLCMLTLAGCMRPLPVRQAPETYSNESEKLKIIGHPPATSLAQARIYLRDYETAYFEQAETRIMRYYKGSDTGAVGSITGMLGGLTKSPQTALAGLLINAGGNIEEQRYQLRVQAANFNNASSAMRCMQRALIPDPIPDVLKGDVETERIFTQQVNEHIDRIKMRLRDQQFSITPNPVNTDQIRDAIQKQLQGMVERIDAVEKFAKEDKDAAVKAAAALAAIRVAAAKEFDGRLGQCSAG